MSTPRSSERGQALVLLVLAFVVLLGFTALAIDGGMVYADRRHAQNGADASSLAGGGAAALYMENNYVDYEDFSCNPNDYPAGYETWQAQNLARAAAISRAADNDFAIDDDISDNNGVTTSCGFYDTGGWIDKYVDITTTITADTQTSFAQFFYNGPLRNTVRAVTRVRPKVPFGLGYAIVALNPSCSGGCSPGGGGTALEGGVNFGGSDTVTISGGGVFSNACISGRGGTGGSVIVDNPAGLVCTGSGCYQACGGPVISPTPVDTTIELPTFSLQVPEINCEAVPEQGNYHGSGHGTNTINPGRYGNIQVGAQNSLTLNPGLYCISGDFDVNAEGSVTIAPDAEGRDGGVTIKLIGANFTVNGGNVQLRPPPNMPNACSYCPEAVPGLLIYMDPSYYDPNHPGEISILGNPDSLYVGTIYAPEGKITVSGDSGTQFNAQLVANTVDVQGNATMNVDIDSALQFRPPASLELFR